MRLTCSLSSSRTVRTLTPVNPAVPTTIPRAMVPPANVNKFVKRSLNLKGKTQAAQKKGWERRKGTCTTRSSGHHMLIGHIPYSKRGCNETKWPCGEFCQKRWLFIALVRSRYWAYTARVHITLCSEKTHHIFDRRISDTSV